MMTITTNCALFSRLLKWLKEGCILREDNVHCDSSPYLKKSEMYRKSLNNLVTNVMINIPFKHVKKNVM